MELTAEEIRVLGCLVEKQATTPEQYPLSTNALLAACNQRSSREPVVEYDDDTITVAMRGLRDRELARTQRGDGSRVWKHSHRLDDTLGLSRPELAVLSVLMLRGPQTAGELRLRAERQHLFDAVDEVEAVLASLGGRELVVRLERQPGQKEARWLQLLGEDATPPSPEPRAAAATSTRGELAELREEVAALRGRLEAIEQALGIEAAG